MHCLAWSALSDLALAFFSFTVVWNLHVNLKRKLGLATLMSLGVFAGVCSIYKTTLLPELTARSDFTWLTIDLLIWSCNEVFVIVVAACIPTLRPLFLSLTQMISSVARSSRSEDNFVELSDSPSHTIPPTKKVKVSSSRGSSQDAIVHPRLP